MKQYVIRYYQEGHPPTDQQPAKEALIMAQTVPSAMNQFEQMYENCIVLTVTDCEYK